MPLELLEQKKELYSNKLNEIMSTSVEGEVNKRLEPIREKLTNEVITELDKDASQCRHYLELINILISESEIKESEEIQPAVDTVNDLQGGM